MRIDEPGQQGDVVALHDLGAVRDTHRCSGADVGDPTVGNDEHRGLDRVTTSAVDETIGDDGERSVGHGSDTNANIVYSTASGACFVELRPSPVAPVGALPDAPTSATSHDRPE